MWKMCCVVSWECRTLRASSDKIVDDTLLRAIACVIIFTHLAVPYAGQCDKSRQHTTAAHEEPQQVSACARAFLADSLHILHIGSATRQHTAG